MHAIFLELNVSILRAVANHKHFEKYETRIICQTNCAEKCWYHVKKTEDWNIKKKIIISSTPKASYLQMVILYVVNPLSLLFYNVKTAWAALHIHDKKQWSPGRSIDSYSFCLIFHKYCHLYDMYICSCHDHI